MAEKSSKLDNITAIDADSVEDTATNDMSLQTRSDDYSSAEIEMRDADSEADEVTAETEELREQIVETRRGMGETIDAIQEKLSFSNISEQVKDQVSEQISGAVETAKDAFYEKAIDVVNTVGKGFRELGKTDLAKKAQQNPTALAIIGAGIGALLVSTLVGGSSSKKNKRKVASYRYDDKSYNHDFDSDDDVRYTDSSRRELQSSDESKDSTLQSARNKVGATASSAYESVSDAAGTAYAGVSGAASSAYEGIGSAASKTFEGVGSVAGKTFEGVGNVAGKTYESVGSAAGFVYDKAGDLGGEMKVNYEYYIEENPLAVGAVALALGAVVGFAIPLTTKENEYMGEYRDNVIEKAQATAQDALGTVKQMASEAQKVITEEVKSKTA
ncbi:MAG: DUF3618 domain-containing protein [Acidobacteriota bacterium]|nr:DUF3618 domain-containing protein [Acidobacteriota bacterium]